MIQPSEWFDISNWRFCNQSKSVWSCASNEFILKKSRYDFLQHLFSYFNFKLYNYFLDLPFLIKLLNESINLPVSRSFLGWTLWRRGSRIIVAFSPVFVATSLPLLPDHPPHPRDLRLNLQNLSPTGTERWLGPSSSPTDCHLVNTTRKLQMVMMSVRFCYNVHNRHASGEACKDICVTRYNSCNYFTEMSISSVLRINWLNVRPIQTPLVFLDPEFRGHFCG